MDYEEDVPAEQPSSPHEARLPPAHAHPFWPCGDQPSPCQGPQAAPEAILTGLETRTSSPVRLKREETLESAQLAGLYPCGEGAGYAGGIMSAAVDGLRVARAIIGRYAPAEG